ncbi:hypothetical protein [Persicobacter diffluens]|uniref:Uncharacterized protein n=1 Tax=Persicobacter diffluens TaxID=981 RepID=A0AAN5APB5_9BACT|nr:hypothetical protein PEDI_42100 [Persicobacter diffluens]
MRYFKFIIVILVIIFIILQRRSVTKRGEEGYAHSFNSEIKDIVKKIHSSAGITYVITHSSGEFPFWIKNDKNCDGKLFKQFVEKGDSIIKETNTKYFLIKKSSGQSCTFNFKDLSPTNL